MSEPGKIVDVSPGHYFGSGNGPERVSKGGIILPDDPWRIGPKGPDKLPQDGEILTEGRGGKGYF